MEAFWQVSLPVQRQIISVAAERGNEEAKDFFIKILDEHTDGTVLKALFICLAKIAVG